jgi:SAM-dependent methyltransferase
MKEHRAATEWIGARGEKWLTQLTGMEAMLAPVDEPLIGAIRLSGPSRIADIGCGGGGTTFEICQRAPKGSTVHGFDLSAALIASARSRKPSGECSIEFRVADLATATPEQPYDRLVSRFGVMFFDDPAAAFTNLFRWLRPGGRIAFAVWGDKEENLWMKIVRSAVAEVVELPPVDADSPGPFRYGDPAKLSGLLDRAGFRELSVTDWRGALAIGGGLPAGRAADFAVASFSSFSELLAEGGSDAAAAARRILTTRLEGHQKDGVVKMGASVHIVTGARLD